MAGSSPLKAALEGILATHGARAAVSEHGRVLTYEQLLGRAQALCPSLLRHGVAGEPVAVIADHTTATIEALLACVLADRVGLPVDPRLPESVRAGLLDRIGAVAVMRDGRVDAVPCPSPSRPREEIAFVYATSGSTGEPRGVALGPSCILHAAGNHAQALGLAADDRVAAVGSLAFGASLGVLWSAWLRGACLCLYDVRAGGPDGMADWLDAERVTVLQLVPTLLRQLVQTARAGETLRGLRVVKLGGEPVLGRDLRLLRERSDCLVVNGLGITEAGGNVCYFHAAREAIGDEEPLPIGRPAPGMELIVEPADGASGDGELLVRSAFLATGYWGDDDATRARFRDVQGRPELRELRTGDLVSLRGDGVLVYRGRSDHRIKVRGGAVDLAHVEAVLRRAPGVADGAAMARRDEAGNMVLHAFVSPATVGVEEVRRHLALSLPNYAMPADLRAIGAIPTTGNGKVDRMALERLASESPPASGVGEPPRDAVEMAVLAAFGRAVGRSVAGVTDRLPELGVDSLRATRLAVDLQSRFDIAVPPTVFMERSTVREVASWLRDVGRQARTPTAILLAGERGATPLFCVPGAGSDVVGLRALALLLGREREVHGLRYPGLEGVVQRQSVEDLAAGFVEALEGLHPVGPVHLLGSSFGGVVAYEMARQLAAKGRCVGAVVLLDSYGGRYPVVRRSLSLRRRALLAVRSILPIGREDELSLANAAAGVREVALRLIARLALARGDAFVPPPWLRQLAVREVGFLARRTYAFPSYQGRVDLIRLTIQPPDILYEQDPRLGWGGCDVERLETHEVEGWHGRHLQPPYVEGVASVVARVLRSVEAGSSGDR